MSPLLVTRYSTLDDLAVIEAVCFCVGHKSILDEVYQFGNMLP